MADNERLEAIRARCEETDATRGPTDLWGDVPWLLAQLDAANERIAELETDLAAETKQAALKAEKESATRHDWQDTLAELAKCAESRERWRQFGTAMMRLDLGENMDEAEKTLVWCSSIDRVKGPEFDALWALRALTPADLEPWQGGER